MGLVMTVVWLAPGCHAYKTLSPTRDGDGASGEGQAGLSNVSDAGTGGLLSASDGGAGAGGVAAAHAGNPGGGGEEGDVSIAGGEATAGEGGASGGVGVEGALAPSNFSGLALWLEASTELCDVDESNGIERCPDLSGKVNDAVQLDAARRPTLSSDVMTGHATMHFEDPSAAVARILTVADSTTLQLGKKDFVVAVVAGWRNDTAVQGLYGGYGILLSKQTLVDPYTGITLIANYPGINPSKPTAPRFGFQLDLEGASAVSASPKLNDGNLRLLVAKRAGLELELRINGVSETRTRVIDVLDVSSIGDPLLIGGVDGVPLRGDVAEVVLIGGEMAEAKLAGLERYFLQKYGF